MTTPEKLTEPRPGNSGRRWLFADLTTLVLGVVAAVVLQVLYLRPPWLYDPTDYFRVASDLPDVLPHHRTLRIGLLLPVRLAIEIFDYSEAAFYLIPTLSLIGLGIATYALGRVWFGRVVGVSAGLLIVANPYVLEWAAQIFPDIPAAAMFAGAIAAVASVGQRHQRGEALTGRNLALLGTAGLLVGWSYLIREFVVILFPILALVLIVYRLPWRAWIAAGVPALGMLGVELVWGWAVYGDALTRIDGLLGRVDGEAPSALVQEVVGSRVAGRGSLIDRSLVFSDLLIRKRVGIGFLGLSLPLFVGALVVRSRQLSLAAAWVLWFWLALTITYVYEDAFGRVILRVTILRYWYPIFPPLIVGGLGGLVSLADAFVNSPRARRVMSTLLVAGAAVPMLGFGLAEAGAANYLVRNGNDHLHELRQWIRANGRESTVVWTDHSTRWSIEMSTRSTWGTGLWDGEVRPFNAWRRFLSEKELQRGFVVLHDDFFRRRLSGWRGATPQYLVAPPSEWSMRFVSSNSEIVVYQIGGTPEETQLLSIGESNGSEWTVVPLKGGASKEVRRLEGTDVHSVDVAEGEQIVLTDNSGPRIGAPRDQVVQPGFYLRNRVDLTFQGTGWVDFVCRFYPPDGGVIQVIGTTLYHPAGHYDEVEFVCRVPEVDAEHLRFRPALVITGPAQVLIDDLTSYVVDPTG